MPKRFNGEVRLDVRDSTEDWSAFREQTAPEGAPNVLISCFLTEQQFAAAMARD